MDLSAAVVRELNAAAARAVRRYFGTQRASAHAAGVSEETWRRWRLGTQRPSAGHRGALLRALASAPFTALERAHGGPRGAAAAAGVSPETWRRWKLGTQRPSRDASARLAGAVRAATPGRVPPTCILTARVKVSSDSRERVIDLSDYVDWPRLVRAYYAGNAAGMAQVILDALDEYVPGMTLDDDEENEIEDLAISGDVF